MKKAAAAAPALALGGSVFARNAGATTPSGPLAGKNLVIFITDQERAIQHFPDNWAEENLPGLTRLQQNGITFNNAFCNACMCSPSRASLFTGRFPAQHGVKYTLEENMQSPQYAQVELPTDFTNLATVMSAAGYDVVYKGKWHLSKPKSESGDFASEDLLPYGFTRWNPPDAGANQSIGQTGGGTTDNDGRYMDSTGSPESGSEGILQYLTEHAPSSQPFCLVISLVNPHDVLMYPKNLAAAGYDDSWLEGDIGLPPTVDEDLSTKPAAQQNFKDNFNLSGVLGTRQRRLDYINFYGNLMKAVDNYLVEVMDALDSTGLTEDTVVIRTADHGEMGTAHGTMRQKNFNAYEESLRIPMVYSNPGALPNGVTCDAMVSHVDLLPTLATLFGAPRSAKSDWQGKDYSDLVLGKTRKPVQDYVAFTFDDYQSGQSTPPYVKSPQHLVSIREANWKIAKYYDAAREVPAQWELYHLRHDPNERRNLAAPGYRRKPFQQLQFRRLKKKLAGVERTRLQPLPYKAFSIRSCTLGDQEINTKMRTPGRGKVIQKVTAGVNGKRLDLGSRTRTILEGGLTTLRTPLNPRELALARRERAVLVVRTTWLPNGGTTVTKLNRITLSRKPRS